MEGECKVALLAIRCVQLSMLDLQLVTPLSENCVHLENSMSSFLLAREWFTYIVLL